MRCSLAIAAAAALAACKAPADCAAFVACGGDLTGAWSIAGTCDLPETSACGERRDVTQSYAGSLTLNSDGSYALDAVVAAHGTDSAPAACFTPPPTSCAALDSMNNGITTTCMGDPHSRCDCVIDEPGGNASETGTFSAANDLVTFSPSDAPTSYGGQYCVKGNELRIKLDTGAGPFIVVLTK